MSAQQLPVILDLQASAEKEAQRVSESFKEKDLLADDKDDQLTKTEPKETEESEILLHIDEQAIVEKKISIFEQYNLPESKTNIFENEQSVNLFTMQQKPLNLSELAIFAKLASVLPPVVEKEEEVHEASQKEDAVEVQPIQPPAKVSSQGTIDKLGKFNLVKFKAGNGSIRQDVFFLLQKVTKDNMKLLYFVLKSEITKVIVYRAFLLPNSQVEDLMNREDSAKLTMMRLSLSDSQVEKSPTKQLVKLQFQRAEQAKRFKGLVLNCLPSPPTP